MGRSTFLHLKKLDLHQLSELIGCIGSRNSEKNLQMSATSSILV